MLAKVRLAAPLAELSVAHLTVSYAARFQMMQIDISKCGEDSELEGALVAAATLRVVKAENVGGRRSSAARASMGGGRVSMDDTLDMIKLVIVGDSGVGKTCLMLRFIKDEFVTSTRATIGMDFCTRQLSVDLLTASENSVVQRLTVQVWDTVRPRARATLGQPASCQPPSCARREWHRSHALPSDAAHVATRGVCSHVTGGTGAVPLPHSDLLSQGGRRDDCLRRAGA